MDEFEFRRILGLFPVVRPRDYHAESELSSQSTLRSRQNELAEWQDAWDDENRKEIKYQDTDHHDAFWEKLKLAAGKKVGAAEAEKFAKAFQRAYEKLVHKELSIDAARSYMNSSKSSEE